MLPKPVQGDSHSPGDAFDDDVGATRPSVVGATANGSLWLGSLLAKACNTASRLSSGTAWSAVSGPVKMPVG